MNKKEIKRAVSSLRRVLAANLRRTRRAQGLTQEELAELRHMSVNQISNAENGKVSIGLDKLAALALALNRELGELLNPKR